MRNLPENQEVLVGTGTIRCEDGPIIFNSLGSLKLHEEDISRKHYEAGHRVGFRMGFIAAVCILGAAWLFSWLVSQ